MKTLLSLIGMVALAIVLIAPFAYVAGGVALSVAHWMMLLGTVLWFIAGGMKLLTAQTEVTD